MKNKFNRCCCVTTPRQPYLYYGGRQTFYAADGNRWRSTSIATNAFPGLNLNAVYFNPNTFSNDLSYRPFGIVTFPMLVEKATNIASATFHIRLLYYNTVPSRIAKWSGSFTPRSVLSNPADVQPNSVSQWEAVRNWVVADTIPFEVNHQATFNDLTFDVTQTAQTLINNSEYTLGSPFAAIVRSTQDPDPLDVGVFNVGQQAGLWDVRDIPPAVDPAPGGLSYQCWLKITV